MSSRRRQGSTWVTVPGSEHVIPAGVECEMAVSGRWQHQPGGAVWGRWITDDTSALAPDVADRICPAVEETFTTTAKLDQAVGFLRAMPHARNVRFEISNRSGILSSSGRLGPSQAKTWGTYTTGDRAYRYGSIGGDPYRIITPSGWTGGGPGVIVCHGRSGTEWYCSEPRSKPGPYAIGADLGERWPTLIGSFAGPSWGSDQALAAFAAAVSHLRAIGCGGPIFVVASSMGAVLALRAVLAGLGVAGVVLLCPVLDLQRMRLQGPPAYRPEMEQAHGIAPGDPLPAGVDPFDDPAVYDLPALIVASPADTVTPYSTAVEWASIQGAQLVTVPACPHEDVPNLVDPTAPGAFFQTLL